MRIAIVPLALLAPLAIVAASGSLVGCFDLFHSTSGMLSECEVDASVCDGGRGVGESSSGPADFCSWRSDEAKSHAEHACAWLGACETPMGKNAFGTCMFDALLAYDCAANPNHPVRGTARSMWDCLWKVQSCDDVQRCVFPHSPPQCGSPGDFTSCASASGLEANRDVRIECHDGGVAVGENCALLGQTCANDDRHGDCAGAPGDAGGLDCRITACEGTHLHQCDGGDEGIDCASNGAQRCGGFRRPGDSAYDWVACVASGDAGCEPSLSAQCSGGYASSCPSGIAESIDCAGLLGVPNGGCVTGTLSPPFDWTSPCRIVGTAACTSDSCSGSRISGCARGAVFTADCAEQGLGPCTMIATDVSSQSRAACTRPR